MKLQFLGTGAADWKATHIQTIPYGRRNASALVDGVLLIDPGPCVPEALETFGIPAEQIKYVIVTHSHADHYNEDTVALLESKGAELIRFDEAGEKQIGIYTVEALVGNHGTSDGVFHYLISDGKSRMYYALDSAWLLYPEYRKLRGLAQAGTPVDYLILDATVGWDGDYRIFEHNDLSMVLHMQKTLAPYLKRVCISHMARTLHTDHLSLAAMMKPYGIEVAYDGLVVEF
ncbi:MAG: MBL fold metallo-hydrolase [Clostridia bacterium]|nr:MBL fold metallo-hydrolase [Clostridia bacterium]